VIPFEDPTILFVNAGMNQFKDVFTGRRKADYPRATTSQKCLRAGGKHNDLDNVGFTARHHTFFEMLGNFSFGDYFKEEAIKYAWEWVTKDMALPIDRLYATVYETDDEAYALWGKIAPQLKNGRIMRFGKHDNYWSMGNVGPCGPCSEIHIDRGEKYGTGSQDVVNGETDRFVEIWNLVFMQYDQAPDGELVHLPKPSVDTGAGLERIAAVMQGCDTNYGIDLFQNLIAAVSDLTGAKYKDNMTSHHVVADHVRALTFALADGAGISNEGRGYVLRRILRRASRHGRGLGARDPFIYKMVPVLVGDMGEAYPEIREKEQYVQSVIRAEEESFLRTLDTGLELFAKIAQKVRAEGSAVVPGDEVFKLYDTYGFPYDLTEIIASEQSLTLDQDGFAKAMAEQQERSRSGRADQTVNELAGEALPESEAIRLLHEKLAEPFPTKILYANIDEDSGLGSLVVEKTPFYVEAGGQISDHGLVQTPDGSFSFAVTEARAQAGSVVLTGEVVQGSVKDGAEVELLLDVDRRWDIMRNHTATHLAHAALRKVLGEHVKQSGSYVGPDRLRFDFSHHQPMTPEEIAEVERLVNEQILEAHDVQTDLMKVDEAKAAGAMALFGEKYGETVRVVSVPGFSKELCGGTHVQNTGQIGPFFITLETGIASGVRRMEAITGREAQDYMLSAKQSLEQASRIVGRPEAELMEGLEQLKEQVGSLRKELKQVKADLVAGKGQSVGEAVTIGPFTYFAHDFGESDRDTMSAWIDSKKEQNNPVVALGIGLTNGKVTVMLAASNSALKEHGFDAGKTARDLLGQFGGRGGGKTAFAQGGVPEGTNIKDVFDKLGQMLEQQKG